MNTPAEDDRHISAKQRFFLFCLSFLIVAFGEPAFSNWLGVFSAACGYALFWATILEFPTMRSKFWHGALWCGAVQLVDISWFISHPFAYIYPVYFFLAILVGAQFGFLCRYINKENLRSPAALAGLAGLWTIMEWLRIFLLSGYSWNPVGLSLTSTLYSMQSASLWGIYGLSFWVVLTNLLALKAWLQRWTLPSAALWVLIAIAPYLYGFVQIRFHDARMATEQDNEKFNALLVQTAFPAEEALGIKDKAQFIAYVHDEWNKILSITKKHAGKEVDLIVLPEFVVPLGTYTFVYPYEAVKKAFIDHYGPESAARLPPLELPFAQHFHTKEGKALPFVNNAFWSQAMANYFDAPIVIGLEDADLHDEGGIDYYSSATLFHPTQSIPAEKLKANPYNCPFCAERYEKRILVPMGEYIPFSFLKRLAAEYGITGSFTPGKEAKVFDIAGIPISPSICYEETFGDLIRESRQKGAEMLVNLTSDVWYPDSSLAKQHFDHSRLRTVEGGVPLLRSCNTGITCGIDSLGRVVKALDEYEPDGQWLSDSIVVEMPTYHYRTLYSRFGDGLIIGISLIAVLFFFFTKKQQ